MVFDQFRFDIPTLNGGEITYEVDRFFQIVSDLTEQDKRRFTENRMIETIFAIVAADKAIWGEKALDFSMSFAELGEKDKAIRDEKLKLLISSLCEADSARNDLIVEGVKNIFRPQQGQIEVIAE